MLQASESACMPDGKVFKKDYSGSRGITTREPHLARLSPKRIESGKLLKQ